MAVLRVYKYRESFLQKIVRGGTFQGCTEKKLVSQLTHEPESVSHHGQNDSLSIDLVREVRPFFLH